MEGLIYGEKKRSVLPGGVTDETILWLKKKYAMFYKAGEVFVIFPKLVCHTNRKIKLKVNLKEVPLQGAPWIPGRNI